MHAKQWINTQIHVRTAIETALQTPLFFPWITLPLIRLTSGLCPHAIQITDEPPELRLPLLEHLQPAWQTSFSAIPSHDDETADGPASTAGDGDGGGQDGCFIYRCIRGPAA